MREANLVMLFKCCYINSRNNRADKMYIIRSTVRVSISLSHIHAHEFKYTSTV